MIRRAPGSPLFPEPALSRSCARVALAQGTTGSFVAPPAVCSPCSCTDPAGGVCDLADGVAYDNASNCIGEQDSTLEPSQPNNCEGFTASDPDGSVLVDAPAVMQPGTCTPGGGQAMVEAPTFSEVGVLCGTSAGSGCEPGSSCLSIAQRTCIYRDGDHSCPGDPFSERHVLYADFQDSRDCSPCDCSSATGEICSGMTEIYAGTNCMNLQAVAPADGASCVQYSTFMAQNSFIYIPDGDPTGGSCATSGGQAEGAVTLTNPTTVCCLPDQLPN